MRLTLVRLLGRSEIEGLKNNEDAALRCGFYAHGNPTQEELVEAHAREPKLLLNYALRNEAVWRRKDTRETLRTLCWTDKDPDLLFPNAYKENRDRFETAHPEWFTEDQGEGVSERQPDLANGLKAIQAGQADLLNHLVDMRTRMTIFFWIVCFVLAAILFRKW